MGLAMFVTDIGGHAKAVLHAETWIGLPLRVSRTIGDANRGSQRLPTQSLVAISFGARRCNSRI
jgi:hypothetical protein